MRILAAAALFAAALVPLAGWAQDVAPVPLPRIERPDDTAVGGPEVDARALFSDEQLRSDSPADAFEPYELLGIGSGAPVADPLADVPQPVTLSAQVTDGGAIIPAGLTWRIFDTRTDSTGQLALVAKSEEATAAVSLPPGQYVVHVSYGRAQATDALTVQPGPNTKTLVLEAGALRLAAAVTGDITIPINLARFDVLSGDDDARVPVAEGIAPNEVLYLNAGVYHVVSHFGELNALVRADLRVEPGRMTEATLYHRASQVSFKLVSQPGGEAIADVDWAVLDSEGDTLFTDIGAFPATVLAEGTYTVSAKRGETVYRRSFEVMPSVPVEIEVVTAAN